MFAASQFASVQYGSISTQVVAGYFITAFESFTIDDTSLIDGSFLQYEIVTLNDSLTIISIATSTIESFEICDVALLIDPIEGTQVGIWRRTSKNDTIWRRIC